MNTEIKNDEIIVTRKDAKQFLYELEFRGIDQEDIIAVHPCTVWYIQTLAANGYVEDTLLPVVWSVYAFLKAMMGGECGEGDDGEILYGPNTPIRRLTGEEISTYISIRAHLDEKFQNVRLNKEYLATKFSSLMKLIKH